MTEGKGERKEKAQWKAIGWKVCRIGSWSQLKAVFIITRIAESARYKGDLFIHIKKGIWYNPIEFSCNPIEHS